MEENMDLINAIRKACLIFIFILLCFSNVHAVSHTATLANPPSARIPSLPTCIEGSLPGKLDVSQDGAANYSIPISVPPGSAGMQPKLTIQYNNRGGNGKLGMGFNIGGLSAITRCPATKGLYMDNFNGGVHFDQNDRFCLDGKKLVTLPGQTYGANGTEYRTQPETFSKIISYGNDGYGPTYFKVWTKSGEILEYGGNSTSSQGRIERFVADFNSPGSFSLEGVKVWAISRSQDRTGKYMEYTYVEDNASLAGTGEYWIDEISYTGNKDLCSGNTCLPRPPYNKVKFIYSNKTALTPSLKDDVIARYSQGGYERSQRVLSKIETYTDGNVVHQYLFKYTPSASSRRTLLSSVEMCSGSTCLPATTFSWKVDSTGPKIEDSPNFYLFNNPVGTNHFLNGPGLNQTVFQTTFSGVVGSYSIGGIHSAFHMNMPEGYNVYTGVVQEGEYGANVRLGADVNNDGRGDVLIIYKGGPGPDYLRSRVNVFSYSDTANRFEPIIADADIGPWSEDYNRFIEMDVNGDGHTDIVRIDYNTTQNKSYANIYLYNKSTNNFALAGQSFLLDGAHGTLNGDFYHFHMVNLNNDGKADLLGIYPSAGGRKAIAFTSTGTGFTPYPSTAPLQLKTSFNEQFEREVVADINGDGLTDVVYVRPDSLSKIEAFVATPFGTTKFTSAGVWNIPGFGSASISNYYLFAIDVNGDGNNDIVDIGKDLLDTRIYIYLSDGRGGFRERLPHINSQILTAWEPQGNRFYPSDLNGDGKMDLVNLNTNSGTVNLFISLGQDSNGAIFKKISNPATLGANNGNANYIPMDYNGDGRADLVRIDGNAGGMTFSWHTYTSSEWQFGYLKDFFVQDARIWDLPTSGEIPDLLTKVTNGFGHTTIITYLPFTHPFVYKGHTSSNSDPETRNIQFPGYLVQGVDYPSGINGRAYQFVYDYEGAKTNANVGFLGFEKKRVNETQIFRKKEEIFLQNFPLTGMLSKSSQTVQGHLVDELENTWTAAAHVYNQFLKLDSVREKEYELTGAQIQEMYTTYIYNFYGDPETKETTWLLSGHKDKVVTQFLEDPTSWLLGLPEYTQIQKMAPGVPTRVRDIATNHNLTTGLLFQQNIDGGYPLAEYFYDDYGNLTETRVTGSGVPMHKTQTPFDYLGRFMVSKTNPQGHQETYTFDKRFGKISEKQDPNGLKTKWDYDSFGRIIRETTPDGVRNQYAYCQPFFDDTTPANFNHLEILVRDGVPRITTYFDVLSRPIRTVTGSFDGTNIFSDKTYNPDLSLKRESLPYFQGDSQYWIDYEYDLLGRRTKQTSPHGGTITTTYDGPVSVQPNNLFSSAFAVSSTQTNSLNYKTKILTNPLGKIIQTQRDSYSGFPVVVNSMQYDAFGNLLKTSDDLGNITTLTYDHLDRQISINDPDTGLTKWVYNDHGENVKTTDANGKDVQLTYDLLSRVTRRKEFDRESNWIYDTAPHGIGLVSQMSSDNGFTEKYDYDTLSRLSKVTTTIDGNPYITQQDYDSLGRIKKIYYPGPAFSVENVYNNFGFLSQVRDGSTGTSFWKADQRDSLLKLTKQTLGNGVETRFNYNPAQRTLISIKSGANNLIQNLEYRYDLLGNVTQRKDVNQQVYEDFIYDPLNRMKSYFNQSLSNSYGKSFLYDTIGNLTFKTGVGNYVYGAGTAGPHAVSSITGTINATYTYDNNGNMLTGRGRHITWYSFSKPKQIDSGTTTVTYKYDPNFRKFKITETTPTTTQTINYINKFYELAGNEHQQYIYAGDTLVAKRAYQANPILHYFHYDNLGSFDKTTSNTGSVLEKLSFDPHGLRRQFNWSEGVPGGPFLTSKGFTGHDHQDKLGFIDMKARLYDPLIGRFLSADPLIPDFRNSESYNRYSYVHNNPMTFTDPFGFSPNNPQDKPDPQGKSDDQEEEPLFDPSLVGKLWYNAECECYLVYSKEVEIVAKAPEKSGNDGKDNKDFIDKFGGALDSFFAHHLNAPAPGKNDSDFDLEDWKAAGKVFGGSFGGPLGFIWAVNSASSAGVSKVNKDATGNSTALSVIINKSTGQKADGALGKNIITAGDFISGTASWIMGVGGATSNLAWWVAQGKYGYAIGSQSKDLIDNNPSLKHPVD